MIRFLRGVQTAFCAGIAAVMCLALSLQSNLPDKYYITEGEKFSISSSRGLAIEASSGSRFSEEVYACAGNSYTVNLKLFGGIAIKSVGIEVVDDTMVAVCGTPFGIKMFTDGVMVVGLSDIYTVDGMACPARNAGISEGDILHSIDGITAKTNEQVSKIISESKGRPITVNFKRGDQTIVSTLRAGQMADGTGWRAGLWVRDSSAGIGTMTFYNPATNVFAGLGHAVCDVDTGAIMPLMSGEIVSAQITGIVRGESGSPGELRGIFLDGSPIGLLRVNSETGVYGHMNTPPHVEKLLPVATKQEIESGEATILTTVSGADTSEYKIIIEKINLTDKNPTKNMVVRVIDNELLSLTGGIVQGMSGSPIIQNGKLIGAITHVFVNDPTKGYAIFAENMIDMSTSLKLN